MSILITGGAGFIGSHFAGILLKNDIDFVVVDNFSNSCRSNIDILEIKYQKPIHVINVDLRHQSQLELVFSSHNFDTVIHFAALKSIEESQEKPKLYLDNNVGGTRNLINMVKKFNIKKFIFSSSATVYGKPKFLPLTEDHPRVGLHPYGQSKIDVEDMLCRDDYFQKHCATTILRYFNPAGSYTEGLIGESPKGLPANLMPYLLGVAMGDYPFLKVFGNDYDTSDGTGVRDYIHIMDLVEAHFIFIPMSDPGVNIYNVGTGEGYSVMQMISVFEDVNKVKIPFKIYPRRTGDLASCYADTSKITYELGWRPKSKLRDICQDAYLFAKKNRAY